MVWVKVPASSANMGAGFDSLGIALSLYNRISVEEIEHGIVTLNKTPGEYIPYGEKNLIYRAAKRVFDEVSYPVKGLKIVQDSEIPMTRGLGSSSACIVGGMLAANVISGRKLDYKKILDLAAEMEGHPDNVAPALFGGFCVAVKNADTIVMKSQKLESPLSFVAMVPEYFVSTRKSRGTLPEMVAHTDAAYNAGRAALFALSLAGGNMQNLKEAVKDRLHQPYRSAYIEHMDETFDMAYSCGAHAVWLSGSGPTIIAVCDKDDVAFSDKMNMYFKQNDYKWKCRTLTVDNVGAVVRERR